MTALEGPGAQRPRRVAMGRARLFALIGWLFLLGVGASPARSARCNATCRADLALCASTLCAGQTGRARRICRKRCKPAPIRTLAYVLTECGTDAEGLFWGRQELRIRRGDREPVTVMDVALPAPVPEPLGLCRIYGEFRHGLAGVAGGSFARLAVSLDGSAVVFEVNDDLSLVAPGSLPLDKGFFGVRSDGSGLRKLGPPSHHPTFRIIPDRTSRPGFAFGDWEEPAVSPDGRTVAYTDLGPGPDGEEAIQIAALNIVTGKRTLLTRFGLRPSAERSPDPNNPAGPLTGIPRFVDNETILFFTYAGSSIPVGDALFFTVKTDGTDLRSAPLPVALPGSRVVGSFAITGKRTSILSMNMPGIPVGADPTTVGGAISEVFVLDGKDLIQLTRFQSRGTYNGFLGVDRQRAFFIASADPLGTNPSRNCQLFSIDRLGAGLRQITAFDEGRSSVGCGTGPPPGCEVRGIRQDPVTGTIVFYSSCNPFGTNPNGGQLFAVRPDGSGLRQLTHARGFVSEPDGTVAVQLPGPYGYSARLEGY